MTEAKPIPYIIVAGLGRCGSSLIMQMLQAAGVPCVGDFPDFEVEQTDHRPVDAEWLEAHCGHALKLLNPHLTPLPAECGHCVVFWCARDTDQQARSQAKFICTLAGVARPDRSGISRWRRNLRTERKQSRRTLRRWSIQTIHFETLIERPALVADRLRRKLAPWYDLETAPMIACVRPRSPDCAPGLDMELELIAEDRTS